MAMAWLPEAVAQEPNAVDCRPLAFALYPRDDAPALLAFAAVPIAVDSEFVALEPDPTAVETIFTIACPAAFSPTPTWHQFRFSKLDRFGSQLLTRTALQLG